jgi:hypothetical protein
MPLSKEEINKRRRDKYALLSDEEKERRQQVSRAYGQAHRKELNEKAKEFRRANPHYKELQKKYRKQHKQFHPEENIWRETKKRARQRQIPFNIEVADIIIPKMCPITGIELSFGVGVVHDGSPSLDRIIPDKGYVKGNCFIISSKANRMKQENTLEDLQKIISYIQERLS